MIRLELTIQNKLGLHTRAAAKFVDIAKHFESKIEIGFKERIVNAKSIMGIITLGAQHQQLINVTIDGPDEEAASQAIIELINNKFGEQ